MVSAKTAPIRMSGRLHLDIDKHRTLTLNNSATLRLWGTACNGNSTSVPFPHAARPLLAISPQRHAGIAGTIAEVDTL